MVEDLGVVLDPFLEYLAAESSTRVGDSDLRYFLLGNSKNILISPAAKSEPLIRDGITSFYRGLTEGPVGAPNERDSPPELTIVYSYLI